MLHVSLLTWIPFLLRRRGRTTTGMVTACLLSMILKNDEVFDSNVSTMTQSSSTEKKDLYEEDVNDEQRRQQNGEYRVILQLISVLSYGKLAKRLTDQAINMCDHMQNLRKAIYDLKLRMDTAETGSSKWHVAEEGFSNYLVRYFYLVVFANYLLEMVDHQQTSRQVDGKHTLADETMAYTGGLTTVEPGNDSPGVVASGSFKSWLKRHREITNIIKYQLKDLL